jgi:hypothetical protein
MGHPSSIAVSLDGGRIRMGGRLVPMGEVALRLEPAGQGAGSDGGLALSI